jgi:NAD(P)-dependent dehydrogenase (short-subunit alcohol dehydrogenase family)
MKSLQQEVVVITGASSGIGRAAALAFAEAGANVVVAARRVEPLAELVDECRRRGAAALAVQTDVTDEGSVRELARRARETFGGIDVWVANAAVSAFGRFEETPPESFRRVIETNFFGYVYGARAVLPHFRTRGRGTLILVGSMLSRLSSPFMSAYVASKHAVRGFAASLRQELAVDGERDIHVAVIMPQSVDTPFFQHSANYTGRAVQVMPPVLRPETVARRIVALARRPRRERFAGNAARALALLGAPPGRRQGHHRAAAGDDGQPHAALDPRARSSQRREPVHADGARHRGARRVAPARSPSVAAPRAARIVTGSAGSDAGMRRRTTHVDDACQCARASASRDADAASDRAPLDDGGSRRDRSRARWRWPRARLGGRPHRRPRDRRARRGRRRDRLFV